MAVAEALSDLATGSTAGHAIVLYDGGCLFCQRSIRFLQRLDWLHKLRFQNCRETEKLPPCQTPLDSGRMLKEMHIVTPNRQRFYAGFAAFRWMAWRLPLTWFIAPLLYLPGVLWLGNRVYRWVARNRFKLVPCQEGVCTLPRIK